METDKLNMDMTPFEAQFNGDADPFAAADAKLSETGLQGLGRLSTAFDSLSEPIEETLSSTGTGWAFGMEDTAVKDDVK